MDDLTRFDELMKEARGMAHSLAKVAILEEAVRIADAHNDVRLGIDARTELIDAANFSGEDAKSMVAFSWCLAQLDKEGDKECTYMEMMWRARWMISKITGFPAVSWEKYEEAVRDVERRYKLAGYSLRPIYEIRMSVEIRRGNLDAAKAYREKWRASPRDYMSNCIACEPNCDTWALAKLGRYEDSLAAAQPILAGRLSCAAVPKSTYAYVLFPLIKLERWDEAARWHKKGIKAVLGDSNRLAVITAHLLYLVKVGKLKTAAEIVEVHLPLLDVPRPDHRFDFLLRVMTLVESLQKQVGDSFYKLKLPDNVPVPSTGGKVDLGVFHSWLDNETQTLADAFDKRNGTPYYNQRIKLARTELE